MPLVWSADTTFPTSEEILGVWGYTPTDVWAVGTNGLIIHYDGNAWTSMVSGTANDLLGVFGFSSGNVWAVGASGTILHYNGTSWSTVSSSEPGEVWTGIWGDAANNIWVSGRFGHIGHWDGFSWNTVVDTLGAQTFYCAYGAASNLVFFGTTNGQAWLWDGASYAATDINPGGTDYFISFFSTSPSDIWAVGGGNHGGTDATIWHYDGISWSLSYDTPTFAVDELEGVWASAADDAWAVSFDGTALHWDGFAWTAATNLTGGSGAVDDIFGFTASDIWAVGQNGLLMHYADVTGGGGGPIGTGSGPTPHPNTPFTQLTLPTLGEGDNTTGAPFLPSPVVPYSQQDLLDLFDRIFPNHYIAPLKDPGPGYELFQAFAQIGARMSTAVQRYAAAAFILSAPGGAYATGTVQLARPSIHPDGISVTVKAGTVVMSSRSGRKYRTTADVLFTPNDLGPFTVPIQAETPSFAYNEPGEVTAADGELLEGEIDTIVSLIEQAPSQPLANSGLAAVHFNAAVGDFQTITSMTGASFSPDSVGRFVTFAGAVHIENDGNRPIVEFISATSVVVRNPAGLAETTPGVTWQEYSAATDVGDLTITVKQIDPTGNGVDPALDQHGLDREIPRGAGESDDAYRGRIRALPDNISPDAVDRAMQQLLFPIGQTYGFIETWEVQYQTCYDAPRDPIPGSPFDPNLCVYDDPFSPIPFRNRWLDLNDMRGAFVVVVPLIPPLRDTGLAYDDTAMTPLELSNPQGARAVTAYDVPAGIGSGLVEGAWDGFDLPKQTLYQTVFNTLERIKAAGTSVAVELQGQ